MFQLFEVKDNPAGIAYHPPCFSVKQLSTQAPTLGVVSAAVANAAAAAGVSGAAGIVTGSPEYRGRSRVNLEAGGELLEAYQTQWERIHVSNEKNAKMATRDAKVSLPLCFSILLHSSFTVFTL